jgi:hypothetical protein
VGWYDGVAMSPGPYGVGEGSNAGWYTLGVTLSNESMLRLCWISASAALNAAESGFDMWLWPARPRPRPASPPPPLPLSWRVGCEGACEYTTVGREGACECTSAWDCARQSVWKAGTLTSDTVSTAA